MLSHLTLYSNLRITRDYSVVYDGSDDDWDYVLHYNTRYQHSNDYPDIIWDGDVNFNRIVETFRIEGNYTDLRKAEYGTLEIPGQRTLCFWVDKVEMVRNGTRITEGDDGNTLLDIVLITPSEDVWRNNFERMELRDTFVERRHMSRWDSDGEPVYYPDAAQGVDGAYRIEENQYLSGREIAPSSVNRYVVRFIVVTALKSSGEVAFFIGMDMLTETGVRLRITSQSKNAQYFTITELMDGSFYSATGITADNVQSIHVTPYIANLRDMIDYDTRRLTLTGAFFNETDYNVSSTERFVSISPNFAFNSPFRDGLLAPMTRTVHVVKPVKNSGDSYLDSGEPMLYMSPARIRKVVTGMGGSMIDIPDIAAFIDEYTMQNIIDFSSGALCVYAGTDIITANAIGALGIAEAPTLPIFNSAWMSYKAISKTGDDILQNAKQMTTVMNGVAGVATSAATAAIPGIGPAVGLLSGGGNVASAASSFYMNEKEMEAKRTTIRNSPCTVTSGGSGLTAYLKEFFTVYYMTLKIDDVSFEKLREQYYFYGYYVNRVFRGKLELKTRTLFDFIKTSGAKVFGHLNGDDRNTLASIFDRGVTIYHNYNVIGKGLSMENKEVSG